MWAHVILTIPDGDNLRAAAEIRGHVELDIIKRARLMPRPLAISFGRGLLWPSIPCEEVNGAY